MLNSLCGIRLLLVCAFIIGNVISPKKLSDNLALAFCRNDASDNAIIFMCISLNTLGGLGNPGENMQLTESLPIDMLTVDVA